MSNDARLSTGLPGHPKTKKLIRRLGPAAGWSLVCLILWARDHRPDGDLSGLSTEDLELAVDWTGENDAFVAALAAVGFIDGEEGSYHLHDWEEHQPWSSGSEARSEKARWASLCRRHGRDEAARLMPDYFSRISATSTGSAASSTDKPATSSDVAVPDSAARKKTPAPSPNPNPSPNPRAEDQEPPIPPAAAGGKRARVKREKITFAAFIAGCRERGEKPVPPTDSIFDYADDAGISREFLELAWREFSRKHRDSQRLQKDWRAHFRDAVRGNWFKLWWAPPEGGCSLTTPGMQAKRARDAEAARRTESNSEDRAA